MRSQKVFRPFFGSLASKERRESWHSWEIFLAGVFGLPIAPGPDLELFKHCTGLGSAPTEPCQEVFCVSGRRSGKSRIASLLCVWQSAFRDWREVLGPGERGKAIIAAVDRAQARTIRDYVGGLLHGSPSLRALIENETRESVSLSTGVDIEIVTSNYKSVRGRTFVFACLEELAFWPPSELSAAPAKEFYIAAKPATATVPGALILGVTSAYARSGLAWEMVQRYWGKAGSTLVWVSDSRTMNPLLSQEMIDEELEKDHSAASAEWLSVFRDDVESFIGQELLRSAIVPGRVADLPLGRSSRAVGAIDPSGGRQDSYTAAVASVDGSGRIVVHAVREARPPFSPESTTADFAAFFKTYGVASVVSDRWGGAWVEEMWRKHGNIGVKTAEQTASDYYLSFLALLSSGKVELPDNPRLTAQFLQLERRVRPGGKDQVTHPPGGFHDDLCNAVALACVEASKAAGDIGFLGTLSYDVRPGYGDEEFCDDYTRKMVSAAKERWIRDSTRRTK
jgi:hypothetical protein